MNKLNKFSRAIFAIAMMLIVGFPSLAHDFVSNGIYYNFLDITAKTVAVTYKGDSFDSYSNRYTGSVTIPSSVTYSNTTYSVTSIGKNAFFNCTGLTSVTIPNSVTEIGTQAFFNTAWYNNQADGVIYAGKVLYKYKGTMPKNTSINIKEGTVSISPSAFKYCSGLTSVTIPNSVTEIGDEVFSSCKDLTSINIPNSVTEIGNSAFYNTAWYNNQADGVIYAGKVLYKYKGTMPKNTSINIKEGTVSISQSAFFDCKNLTSITIPNSATVIGSSAFYSCDDLTSVTIGNSITEIGDWAFRYCKGLTSVTIPNSVTSIGDYAFDGCYLETIVSLNPTPPTCSSLNSFHDYYATLYVPKDRYTLYSIYSVWEKFSNIKKIETLVSSITLNETTLTINSGSDYTLKTTISPWKATIPNLTWESDNSAVATVDQNGNVTGISAGTATIIVRANDGSNVSASCKVTVGVGGVEDVKVDNNAVEVGRFDIYGRRLSKPTKGLNIVVYSDGTTKKVEVKE